MTHVSFVVIKVIDNFAEAEEDAAFVNSYQPPQRPYQLNIGQK